MFSSEDQNNFEKFDNFLNEIQSCNNNKANTIEEIYENLKQGNELPKLSGNDVNQVLWTWFSDSTSLGSEKLQKEFLEKRDKYKKNIDNLRIVEYVAGISDENYRPCRFCLNLRHRKNIDMHE